MISEHLIPMIQDRFPNLGSRERNKGNHVFTFPPKIEEYGPVQIYDDEDEVTVYLGRFTHGHFSNYEEGLTMEEKERKIAEDVIHFLEALFDDRVLAWGSHSGMGGWKIVEDGSHKKLMFRETYAWSGNIEERK